MPLFSLPIQRGVWPVRQGMRVGLAKIHNAFQDDVVEIVIVIGKGGAALMQGEKFRIPFVRSVREQRQVWRR